MRALRNRYAKHYLPGDRNRWALIEELHVGPHHMTAERRQARADHQLGAETDWDPRDHTTARIDAWAMHLEQDLTHAFEIKVDVADFKRELADPEKRRPAMLLANQFYFVAPKGLISADDIPEECGLLEVEQVRKRNSTFADYRIVTPAAKRAPWREIEDLPRHFIASIALRAS